MNCITEFGISQRQHSRTVLSHQSRGIRKLNNYLKSNESQEIVVENEETFVKLEFIRDLFVFKYFCISFCILVLILEILYKHITRIFCLYRVKLKNLIKYLNSKRRFFLNTVFLRTIINAFNEKKIKTINKLFKIKRVQ
jgi:hypothetical protein